MQTTIQTNVASTDTADDLWGGRQLIDALQAKAREILDSFIPANVSIALLDYPNNPNVGDSLIWLGEIAYLNSRNIKPSYVCDVRNYNANILSKAICKDSIILLQGGGNFGTLWPEVHEFRLRVLSDFPNNRVIQLPQSIHFDNLSAIQETAKAVSDHKNFTLLVRDQPSFDFASKYFECKVVLCPDMAFFIGAINSKPSPSLDRFILSRTDHEKNNNWVNDLPTVKKNYKVAYSDWLQASWHERIVGRIERHTAWIRKVVDPHNQTLLLLWTHLAKLRLNRGKGLLEEGRVIISDRLHVHILSILLNKPHVLIDNANKKISSLHEAWTKQYLGVNFVKNIKEAFSAADRFDSISDKRR
ncbi:MAG: polysaccharide pyruvyl transferase family protein [Methylotenera sp.]|nr:polysaccharide pyruvyl transferase family protein [Methylotenera sp.]